VINSSAPDFVGCAWLDTQAEIEREARPDRDGQPH
jgi:hypothetical protein